MPAWGKIRGGFACTPYPAAQDCAEQTPAADCLQRPLGPRSRFWQRLRRSVDMICIATDCAKNLFAWRNRCVNQQTY